MDKPPSTPPRNAGELSAELLTVADALLILAEGIEALPGGRDVRAAHAELGRWVREARQRCRYAGGGLLSEDARAQLNLFGQAGAGAPKKAGGA